MARSRSRRYLVTQVRDSDRRRVPDELIVEEPLTIVVNGTVVSTTMRTPGHDFDLAVGFCLAEGLIGATDVRSIRYCSDSASAVDNEFNRVEVLTARPTAPIVERLGTATSSCGWCGSTQLDEMIERMSALPAAQPIADRVLAAVATKMRDHQDLFLATGASHAAARFRADGEIGVVREDVGRHNAVDKVVGAALLNDELPATGDGLFVSGRASVEMVQKAWSAGFSTLLAVSAPTALAVDAARRAGMQLVGFARGDTMNVYSPERSDPS